MGDLCTSLWAGKAPRTNDDDMNVSPECKVLVLLDTTSLGHPIGVEFRRRMLNRNFKWLEPVNKNTHMNQGKTRASRSPVWIWSHEPRGVPRWQGSYTRTPSKTARGSRMAVDGLGLCKAIVMLDVGDRSSQGRGSARRIFRNGSADKDCFGL